MKSFLKTVLAVVVGLFAATVLGTFCVTCAMVASLTVSDGNSRSATQPGDVMFLKINGEVNEVPPFRPFTFDALNGFQMNQNLSLREYLDAIDIAQLDPNIVGIYLNTDGMTASPATYEALHDALSAFRRSGKWIVAYNDNYTLGQYYVASVADSVFVNTIGSVAFDGLASSSLYPKGLLDKLGIEMQVFRVGTFKSAVEPYMIDHMSDANRLQIGTYLNNIWKRMADDVAQSRGIAADKLDSLAHVPVGYMLADELAKSGLVDNMLYKSEVEQILLDMTGRDELQGIKAKELVDCSHDQWFPQDREHKIAVLYATGEIASEARNVSGSDDIYYEDLIDEIRDLADDDEVAAVVLRVNSPGGSGFASEQIWHALEELRAQKPLVVSMSDYAASGGYYISCCADYIVAEPNTLTGSIGVFGVIPNFSRLTSGRLGINFEEVKTHKFGQLSVTRPLSSAEKQKLQRTIEDFYGLFVMRCAEGRKMPLESIMEVAGGRVWTGSDAVRLGLADELGGINRAIAKAIELAGLEGEPCSRVCYPSEQSSFESMMQMFSDEADDLSLKVAEKLLGAMPIDRTSWSFIRHLQQADHVQARSFDVVEF
jgi:protease-4